MSYAVLVLEQPWWSLDEDPGQTSARHFLDGLSRLAGLAIFHATFYDTSSFGLALKYLVDAHKLEDVEHLIVYVASHGAGSRIGNGNAPTMNLGTVFDRIQKYGKGKVVGLILDNCEVGAQFDTIESGMACAKIRWVIGYGASIDWLTSTLINLHVLSAMTQLENAEFKQRKALTAAVQGAFGIFNPHLNIEPDDDDEVKGKDAENDDPLALAEVLTVAIRLSRHAPEILSPNEIWPALDVDQYL